jgi:predicted amidohydrolase
MTRPARPDVTTPSSTGRFVLRDGVVVDVAAGARKPVQDVEIVDGVIARIGPIEVASSDLPFIDGDGGFVVPGLVDSPRARPQHFRAGGRRPTP